MLIYTGYKSDFDKAILDSSLADQIEKNILEKMGRKTPKNEFRSWENSLQAMYVALSDQSVPSNAGIAIEYNIPQTSKRVDFMISGKDKFNKKNVVIVELKQWEKIEKVDSMDALVKTYVGGSNHEVVHPSYQAWSYASLIKDFNVAVQRNSIELYPCAYLHNYKREKENDQVDDQIYSSYTSEAPVFSKGQALNLREFITDKIRKGDCLKILNDIEQSVLKPSKSLQNELAGMLNGNKAFYMIDDQKIAYEQIKFYSLLCKKFNTKKTIIVKGGPGTGKSVIAVNLLVELIQKEQFVQYVSKNSAPREVYTAKLAGSLKKNRIRTLFTGSGSYTNSETNQIDTLLADEAHRLNEKSGIYSNLGENQIKEIIHAAKCSVFFLDEDQRVTFKDIGSSEEIKKWAHSEGSEVIELELHSQFRCNGSDGYLAWLDDVLGIRETANYSLEEIDYDIRILDTPQEVYDLVREKNSRGFPSRLLAGYCWNWKSNEKNNSEYHDIQIGDFSISWNLGNTKTYAIQESSINECGCIHTCQGLEFDYVGVIIGDDLRFVDGEVITDPSKRATTDKSLTGFKKLYKSNPEAALEKADAIIRNTYRTLLSRGMKGCFIFCTDIALSEYLKERLEQVKYDDTPNDDTPNNI